jgi:hypothetical protein
MNQPKQNPRTDDQPLQLPEGVTTSEWNLEKVRFQNPRIRSLLGCIRLLEGVLESNYAILHCSPARLREIGAQVRRVADQIRFDLVRYLEEPSRIPKLEEARQDALDSLALLDKSVLQDLDRFPEEIPAETLSSRKLLCVSIGKLHAFLQETFGKLVASDPRSLHEPDYFLSKRFPKDVEEAEWLHHSVQELNIYLQELEQRRFERLTVIREQIRREEAMPGASAWDDLHDFLLLLFKDLTPRLTEILALRGIRFDEMEVLDNYAADVPRNCRLLMELAKVGYQAIERIQRNLGGSEAHQEQNAHAVQQLQRVLSARMSRLLHELDRTLRDLTIFVPVWLQQIEKRRALILRRDMHPRQRVLSNTNLMT